MLGDSTAISEQKGPFFSNQKAAPHLKATMDISGLQGGVSTPFYPKPASQSTWPESTVLNPSFKVGSPFYLSTLTTFLPLYILKSEP